MNEAPQKREKIRTPEQEQRSENFKKYSADIVSAITEASPIFAKMAKDGMFTAFGIRCKALVNIPAKGVCMGTYCKLDHLTKKGEQQRSVRFYVLDAKNNSQFKYWLQVEDGWTYHDVKNDKEYVCKLVGKEYILLLSPELYKKIQ